MHLILECVVTLKYFIIVLDLLHTAYESEHPHMKSYSNWVALKVNPDSTTNSYVEITFTFLWKCTVACRTFVPTGHPTVWNGYSLRGVACIFGNLLSLTVFEWARQWTHPILAVSKIR